MMLACHCDDTSEDAKRQRRDSWTTVGTPYTRIGHFENESNEHRYPNSFKGVDLSVGMSIELMSRGWCRLCFSMISGKLLPAM